MMILDMQYADVNGDCVPDCVFLTGEPFAPDTSFFKNIRLNIQDGRTHCLASFPLLYDTGYEPRLFFGDFTGDGVADIFISIATGGSGGLYYYYLFSYVNNQLVPLFNPETFNTGLPFDVIFEDGYKVSVISNELNKKFIIDVSQKKDIYTNIYDKSGKLIKPTTGFVIGYGGLYPIYTGMDNRLGLFGIQKIAGLYNADTIGYVESQWKYEQSQLNLQRINVTILGYDYE